MDLLTRSDVKRLAAADHDGPYVSLFMPTHRFGNGVEADRLRWKNLVTNAESVLAGRGMRRPDIEALLDPAYALERDGLAWQHMSDGLAMFLRPGHERTFRVPVGVPEIGTVGDRFIVGPLLRVLSGDEHFLVLALSQRRVRLLEGSRDRVEEVVLQDVPTSLRDVIEAPEPRSDTMARPTVAGRGGPAIFYGHGAGDDHFRTEEVQRFLRLVADGLDGYLVDEDLPLVLVGLDHLVAVYRDVTRYPHVMDDAVVRNPDELSAEELHTLAWPVAAQRLRDEAERVIEQFGELHGTGRASADPERIEEAAAHGRVESLLARVEPSCWEEASTRPQKVLGLGTDPAFAPCELLDRAAVATLANGGRTYAVPDSLAPDGADIAAVFRY